MQAVLPQFLQDFWLLTELSPCQWSLKQNTSSSPLLNHVYLKRSSFKYFSMAPVPSLIYSVQLFKTGLRETGMVNNKPLSRQALIQLLALPNPSVLKVFPKNLHSPSLLDSSKRRYHLSLQTLIPPAGWGRSTQVILTPNPIWFILLSLTCLSPSTDFNNPHLELKEADLGCYSLSSS